MSSGRIVLVGIGGATCSGKTTLAKHVLRILSKTHSTLLVHQDDFAPLEATLPIHPVHGWADWDTPKTAIDYPKMVSVLQHLRSHHSLPSDFASHDHLNSQPDCPIDTSLESSLIERFQSLDSNDTTTIVLVDGFLLYYDVEVRNQLDVRILLRVNQQTLKQRRQDRFGYATGEGTVWQDPPGYFDEIVWPAYKEAHHNVFQDGNLDYGKAIAPTSHHEANQQGGPIERLLVLDANPETQGSTMETLVDQTCSAIYDLLGQ